MVPSFAHGFGSRQFPAVPIPPSSLNAPAPDSPGVRVARTLPPESGGSYARSPGQQQHSPSQPSRRVARDAKAAPDALRVQPNTAPGEPPFRANESPKRLINLASDDDGSNTHSESSYIPTQPRRNQQNTDANVGLRNHNHNNNNNNNNHNHHNNSNDKHGNNNEDNTKNRHNDNNIVDEGNRKNGGASVLSPHVKFMSGSPTGTGPIPSPARASPRRARRANPDGSANLSASREYASSTNPLDTTLWREVDRRPDSPPRDGPGYKEGACVDFAQPSSRWSGRGEAEHDPVQEPPELRGTFLPGLPDNDLPPVNWRSVAPGKPASSPLATTPRRRKPRDEDSLFARSLDEAQAAQPPAAQPPAPQVRWAPTQPQPVYIPAYDSTAAGNPQALDASQLLELKAKEDSLVKFLIDGTDLLKHTNGGRTAPHVRFFSMNVTACKVMWRVKSGDKKFRCETVTEILPGCSQVKLHRKVTVQEDALSFTLVTPGYKHNLVVQARDPSDYEW